MNRIRIVSLYSGSTGNSTLVETPLGAILIDAGKSARSLCAALKQAGSSADKIKAVFVTHEHTDHVSALEVFLKKNPVPVHITSISAENLHILPDSRLSSALRTHTPIYSESVIGLTVTSFPVSHDSAMCVGYRIETEDGFSFGLATDTGCITEAMIEGLGGCEAVVIESNHSVEKLRCGPYPEMLKRRILSRSGHLSNDDCATLIRILAEKGTKSFLLAHISRENNDHACAVESAKKALEGFEGISLFTAKPETETEFVVKVQ